MSQGQEQSSDSHERATTRPATDPGDGNAFQDLTFRAEEKAGADAESTLEHELDPRDHRVIGKEMKLWAQLSVAPGSPVLFPKGLTLYRTLQGRMHELLDAEGYQEIRSPVMVNTELFERSGHLAKFGDNMFVFGEGEHQVALKPMNCPCHMEVFGLETRSYRDLPLRIHDEGSLFRNERSGTLEGMARLRNFHQDDTHIFVAPEQIEGEVSRLLAMTDRVYSALGLEYKVSLSTRPEKFMGEEALWDHAEETLKATLDRMGIEYQIDEGEGAFYGPKIDIHVQGANKEWQLATTQLDFQLPQNFNLSYVDQDGEKKRPVVIHTATYGTMERFMAVYLEHTQGNLPVWLAPEQVRILPVSEKTNEYARELLKEMKAAGIRVTLDDSDERLGAKIKASRPARVPYGLIVGPKEAENGTVSVRHRDGTQEQMTAAKFIAKVVEENNFSF